MSNQQMFQIVSTGKTLPAKQPAQVLRDVAGAFALSLPQARRLLTKGWVIKDRLSSKQATAYRTRLQKVGLHVEVYPAGRFDNKKLLAKLRSEEKRRASSAASEVNQSKQTSGHTEVQGPGKGRATAAVQNGGKGTSKAKALPSNSKARAQIEALFGEDPVTLRESAAERAQLAVGAVLAGLVPALFLLLAIVFSYSALRVLWEIIQIILAGELGLFTVLGEALSLSLIAFCALLFLWPFFIAKRYRTYTESEPLPLKREEAPGLFLLINVLAEKTGLSEPRQLSLSGGVEVVAEPEGISDLRKQCPPLRLGLAAIDSLSGSELLALVARTLGTFKGRLRAVTAWLVLDTAKRLQLMQWALENERTAIAPDGRTGILLLPLHRTLTFLGHPIVPVVGKLYDLHRTLTAPVARLLERQGDAWAAQLVGSEGFAPLADKWHRLVHAELVVAEINREASLMSQHLADYPGAVAWTLHNLDEATCSNIELAMAQASDSWDPSQPADNERITWAEALALKPIIQQDFSVRKLFTDFAGFGRRASTALAGEGSRPVDNRQLLCVSKESEQAQQILAEYFNQLPPSRLLSLQLPANEDIRTMGLQAAIDWLRDKLVELRELEQFRENLRIRGAAMLLGSALIKKKVKIDPDKFFLAGTTTSAADESLRENRTRREQLESQREEIFGVFYLRISRALESMAAAEQQAAQRQLGLLKSFQVLAPLLNKLDYYAESFGMMIDRLSLDGGQRVVIQNYCTQADQELQTLCVAVTQSAVLKKIGLQGALEARIGSGQFEQLPRERQEMIDTLQALELKCKNACAVVCEAYRMQLVKILWKCMERERALKVRPLRLVGATFHQ